MTNLTHGFKPLSGDPYKEEAKWGSPDLLKTYWDVMDCLKIYHKMTQEKYSAKRSFSSPLGGINLSVGASQLALFHSSTELNYLEEPGCHMVYQRSCLINLAKQTFPSSCCGWFLCASFLMQSTGCFKHLGLTMGAVLILQMYSGPLFSASLTLSV